MSQKIYLTILKSGVYLSLISVFLVYKNLLFPFITSKQISFNILIEILLIFWFAFIIKYPKYRPKKSWISIGLLGFFFALILSCFSSVDFNLSFWGDVERMLGVFHLLHFLALYFIIITVMREWKDWKIFFIISIIFAVFVSLKGLAGTHYSTIGNTAYVSGYLIFNMYFAVLLFFREKSKIIGISYLFAIPIMMLEFKKAGTTGAYVGLGFSILVALFLYAFLYKNKKIKTCMIACFLFFALFTGFIFEKKDSDFVKNNSWLRVVNEVSFEKDTFQTRLISWRTALKDFKNHPILGTGHGNFAITFDKYFEPTFYDYTRSETYFDRAHNNLVDIGSTSGLLGLLAYLSIFFATAYYLIFGYRKEKINIHEFILLSSLIIAYFTQNLAVFDSLVTYIGLMMTLGFIYWLVNKDEEDEEIIKDEPLNDNEIFALAGFGFLILVIMFQYNIRPLQMLIGTINGQKAISQGDANATIEIYRKALSYDTVLDRDSRASLIRLFASNPNILMQIDEDKRQEAVDYLIDLAEINVDYNPGDSLNQLMLAQILNVAAEGNRNNQEKFLFYSDRAIKAVDKSIEASHGRIPLYYIKSQIYSTRNEGDKAIETLEYAASLNENYYDSFCYLSRYYFSFDNQEKGFENLDKCIDKGGVDLLSPADYVKSLINYYDKKNDKNKIIKLMQRLSRMEPENSNVFIDLTKLYAEQGRLEEAKESAKKVGELDSSLKNSVDEYILELEEYENNL